VAKFKIRLGYGPHHDRKTGQRHTAGEVVDLDRLPPEWLDKFEPVDIGARKMVDKALGRAAPVREQAAEHAARGGAAEEPARDGHQE